jgi:uncharacterized damage-inducible protein DinB
MSSPGNAFLRESAHLLRDVYLPRLERAAVELRPADAWWRPHERATSIANLLLHLDGNVRQWILSGLAGADDRRDRAAEFSAREGSPLGPLLERLAGTARAAARVIEEFPENRLTDPIRIQGFDTTGTSAIYHVVEHFSWHTGQIVWIAKERAGAGHRIAFYDEAAVNRARNTRP